MRHFRPLPAFSMSMIPKLADVFQTDQYLDEGCEYLVGRDKIDGAGEQKDVTTIASTKGVEFKRRPAQMTAVVSFGASIRSWRFAGQSRQSDGSQHPNEYALSYR